MLQEFHEGRFWSYDRCRIVDRDGSIRWVAIGVNLSRDPETGDICMYSYLSRADRRVAWEKSLKEALDVDPGTGIYHREAMEKLVRHLRSQNSGQVCTLAQICITGADEIFSRDDLKMKNIAAALQVFLNTDCLVGWKDEKSFLVFFPGDASRTQIRSRLENAFSFTRISLSGIYEMRVLRFIAGAVRGKAEEPLEKMMSLAEGLCAIHAGEAADAVEFAREATDYSWDDMLLENDTDSNYYEEELAETTVSLTEEENEIALACMELMLLCDNAQDSMEGVLQRIGEYYQADRVYILALTEEKQIMTLVSEWAGADKYSIRHSVSGKPISSFPVIANYVRHPEKRSFTRQRDGQNVWKYAIFPMDRDRDTERILCVENPGRAMEHTALLEKLIPCMVKERKDFWEIQKKESSLEQYFALPNMDDCMDALYAIDSDRYGSLGVLMVDVPEYDRLKARRGYEYGRNLLLHISQVLLEVFGKSCLFHTLETEFVILCTDTVYHSFLNLCARARRMIGRRNTGVFRMGYTWSGRAFDTWDLVKKARSIMECDRTGEQTDVTLLPIGEPDHILERKVTEKLQTEGELTIYLQPKIDMRSGRLMGAEVLTRIVNQEGKLLPHGQLIDEMEKEGTIQQLDYLVFERMLETMSQWQEKGYPLYPMSSNFSRTTLLNSSALASVLAIMSRYPAVPQEMIELEITETAGDYENNTFAEVIRQFAKYGLRFSMDDFGAGYSNMNMLAELKFHSVKLDRSLIRNITENPTTRMIVQDLIHICDSCGMLCIAEGVETRAQAEVLLEDGCFCAQGFYYGRPMPPELFEKKYLLEEQAGLC